MHRISNQTVSAGMVLTAMTLMGLADNYVIVIAESAGLWQFQVIRSGLAMCMLVGLAGVLGWRLRPVRWKPVILRSLIMSCALIIYFASLAIMPISEAVAGLFTAPIFVLLISAFVFGHHLGPVRIVAVLLGFLGVLLVLRPDAGEVSWLSVLPIVSGFFYGLGSVVTREWCKQEPPLAVLFGFFTAMGIWGLLGLLGLAIGPVMETPVGPDGFMWRFWGEMTGQAWFWTVAQAVLSLVAVGFIIRAYQIAEPSYLAVFEYGLLVAVVFWGFVLLGISIDHWAAIGIALILASGVLMAAAEGRVAAEGANQSV